MRTIIKIWTIISLLFFLISEKGKASDLYLSMWNNSGFSVEINHRHYSVSSHDLVIRDLHRGTHHIVVYQNVYRSYHRHGNGYAYGHRKHIVYSGIIDIPRESTVTAQVSRRNLLNIISIVPHHRYHKETRYHHAPAAMGPARFREMKKRLMYMRFESDRLDYVERKLELNFFTSRQVYEIVSLFDFEAKKVKVAKMAYHKTVDPHNFDLVYDAFIFSTSIDEVERYIYRYDY